MAPPMKPGAAVTQAEQGQGYSSASVEAGSPVAVLGYILRFAAVVLALVAAIVMGAAKQTAELPISEDLVQILTVKAITVSAFKFFVAANAIACAYGLASLALSILSRGASRNLALVLTLLDLVMVALLFSGNGAASAIGVVARNGEGNVWPNLCNIVGKACGRITASIVLSTFAALAYLLLVLFSVLGFHSRAKN
uniref:CASP-like protein n=1 Tax=Anthurium amnicola TaxID=1678845 RepID=A0A1D1ZIM7_9ARAE